MESTSLVPGGKSAIGGARDSQPLPWDDRLLLITRGQQANPLPDYYIDLRNCALGI